MLERDQFLSTATYSMGASIYTLYSTEIKVEISD